MTEMFSPALETFRAAYANVRASEGRAHDSAEMFSLPYLRSGPLAKQWAVRARTFDAFVADVVVPMGADGRRLQILDLGSGNGWLSYRLARLGHDCTAVDIRDDCVDGLGAAAGYQAEAQFQRVVASFDAIPVAADICDLALFNASLHYSTDLTRTLSEAARLVRPGGRIAILDSPFYTSEADGQAMVAEKHRLGEQRFGKAASAALSLPVIEFLTRERLGTASAAIGLHWRRRRVLYPLWYELRPLVAALTGRRRPSRFDLWVAELG